VILEKSIAVLPFENLSSNKENAYFTEGVQDEILTDLAKIADLKVISRASVMQYKPGIAQSDDDSRFDSCGFVKFVSKIVVSLGPK
jgi:TolB-like protein